MGYCSLDDIFSTRSSMVIAKWIRLNIPDFISFEKRTALYSVLSESEQEIFDRTFILDVSGEYKLLSDMSASDENLIVSIFMNIDGSKIIDATIEDVTAEIDMSLATGGYSVPVANEAAYYNQVRRMCKYLTLYTIMINGGALEVEGDKQFIDMCVKIKEELTMISTGKMKLPLKHSNRIFIKTPEKVTNWQGY